MRRLFAISAALLLAGCATRAPPQFPACPQPPVTPTSLRPHEPVVALEIRVEIAREAERRRGDACAAAVAARDAWIRSIK